MNFSFDYFKCCTYDCLICLFQKSTGFLLEFDGVNSKMGFSVNDYWIRYCAVAAFTFSLLFLIFILKLYASAIVNGVLIWGIIIYFCQQERPWLCTGSFVLYAVYSRLCNSLISFDKGMARCHTPHD